ncbi:hypothetical protein PCK1_001328 [Pneumocystis canis]|nr:hypothetical protein PCK1_001328 [Pneumocystis canis]
MNMWTISNRINTKNILKRRKLYNLFLISQTKYFLQQNLSTLPMTPIFKKLLENDRNTTSIEFKQYHESFSYCDLINYISAFKTSLKAIKYNEDLKQKRIGIFIEPGFMYTVAILGIWAAGGIAVPICITHPIPEIKYIVEDCQMDIIITSLTLKERLEDISTYIKKYIYIHVLSKSILIQKQEEAQKLLPFDLNRGALILYTSGTTGSPKGVLTTHKNISTQVMSLVEAWKYSSRDRLLHILPLHHIHGIINTLICPLYVKTHAGGTVEFLQKFIAKDVWFRFLDEKSPQISQFMAVPTIYSKLIDYYINYGVGISDADLKSRMKKIRLMVSGSAELPISLRKKWHEITGQILLERYGMTETGMILSGGLEFEKRLEGSVGWELPYIKVQLVNTENSVDEGEIWVSGDTVFKEYFNKPEETQKAFVYEKDGTRWFKTNDIATKTKDVWIQRVAALISLTSDKKKLTLKEFRSDLKNVLASYKIPTVLKILPSGIPRTHMGKVDKKSLIKEFEYGDVQRWID